MDLSSISVGGAAKTAGQAAVSNDNGADEFEIAFQKLMDYLHKNPVQIMEEKWLERHGLTRDSLAALPQDKQDAVREELAAYIRLQLTGTLASGKSSLTVV